MTRDVAAQRLLRRLQRRAAQLRALQRAQDRDWLAFVAVAAT